MNESSSGGKVSNLNSEESRERDVVRTGVLPDGSFNVARFIDACRRANGNEGRRLFKA